MIGIQKNIQRFAISLTAAVCMAGIPALAHTKTSTTRHSRSEFSKTVVRHVQGQLKADGFYHGKIDGISGPQTHAALRAYQRDKQLAVTGRLDRATLRNLRGQSGMEMGRAARSGLSHQHENMMGGAARAAQPNNMMSQTTIQAVQRQLKQSGIYNGAVDGRWNSGTQAAVRQYQQNNNLKATGRIDQETLNSLGIATTTRPNTNMQNQNNMQNPNPNPDTQNPDMQTPNQQNPNQQNPPE